MSVVKEIAEWAKELPPWQSDALRRIYSQEDLSVDDEDHLLKMVLAANGIVDAESPAPEAVLFSVGGKAAAGAQSQVVLNELHSVLGVNALIPDQAITFALDGVTIIYGENGAGKSGYSRVLKHSCHAREQNEPIHPNIAETKPPKPSAVLELTVDGVDVAITWTKGMAPSSHLLEIAVFDSHCARVFLDDANEVVYLPHGSDVFPKLVDCMRRLRDKVKAQLAAISPRLAIVDEFGLTTTAGRFVRDLNSTSDPTRVDLLRHFEAKETERLQTLRDLIATAKVNPPREQAAQLRRRKTRLDQIKARIEDLDEKLSVAAVASLQEACSAASTADEAAKLASTHAFKDEPLSNTGSAAWKLLFNAAKTFSLSDAYPDKDFPHIGVDAACVLCQQPLSTDAKERMARFEKFVSNEAAKAKERADKAYSDCVKTVSDVDVRVLETDATYVDDLRAVSEDLVTTVSEYFRVAKSRKEGIARACESGEWQKVPALPEPIIESLSKQIASLEASAVEFDKADNPEALKKLEAELAELEDKERTGKYAIDIKNFIAEKKKEACLKECERTLDTSNVTRYGSELVAKIVTEQLEACLAEELQNFSVHKLPLQLKKSGDKGKTRHQLTITSDVRPSGVLSEGEQRVVAIACFLAELAAVGHSSPIVFDDPVSSLDHLYREKVAARLVKEAASRQVVVFTHDITLLLALERECAEKQVPLLAHTVRRAVSGPGECTAPGTKPWHCQTTTDRIKFLRNACAPFKKLEASDPDDFEVKAKDVYGKLRETWERAIEEVVLNGVITRFDPAIQTKRLSGICLEATDYAKIDQEMSKCSTRFTGHDTAPALALGPITADELIADIETLDAFVKEMKKKQDKAKQAANDLLKPPTARVAGKRAANSAGDGKLIA